MSYFSDREAFIKYSIKHFTSAVPAMESDEAAHRLTLANKNITINLSVLTIDQLHCDTYRANVIATELVHYSIAGASYTEAVIHDLTIYPDETGIPIVTGDGYYEEFSGFKSCSYVPPVLDTDNPLAIGSRYCIVSVANGEVGYTPDSSGKTKYGEYAGSSYGPWCASFVSWCAHQANISENIIQKTAWAPDLKSSGEFFPSKSQGGSSTPRTGDLFFEGSSTANISHVGIVTSVDSNYIYVIDGNCNGKVNSHSHSLSSSSVVGYTRPAYGNASHSYVQKYNSTKHWKECLNCSATSDNTNHSLSYTSDINGHWNICSCGYKTASAQHNYSSAWNYDATYHWHKCTVCGRRQANIKHTYSTSWSYNGTYHWHKCSTCANKQSLIKHTFRLSGGNYICTSCGYKTTSIPGTTSIFPSEY